MVVKLENSALVEPDWLSDRLDDPGLRLVQIDWVGTEAYDQGHIPGAIGWNWKDWLWDPLAREFPSPEEFARRCGISGIANDTTVIFYGEPPQFGTYAWWVFKYMNHENVRLLDGGWRRWKAESRPLVTERPFVQPVSYEPSDNIHHHMRASREEVLASLGEFKAGTKAVLLDHRSPEEFRGELVNVPGKPDVGAERYGRIPGAKHLHFADFLQPDTSFKSRDELQALLAACGATPDKRIVSYCRLSHRATLAYFVMTELLGYDQIKSYDGSWTEWGSMVGMPIER